MRISRYVLRPPLSWVYKTKIEATNGVPDLPYNWTDSWQEVLPDGCLSYGMIHSEDYPRYRLITEEWELTAHVRKTLLSG